MDEKDELPQYSNQDYTVGWLCALASSELTAARRMLDKQHKSPVNANECDENAYIFGEIAKHNVVIACMPPQLPGNLSAQKLVQPLKRSFPNMTLHLFVGIGGGIPYKPPRRDPNDDIHLGDVVVGWPEWSGVPAVVQYDHVRQHVDGNVELLSMLDKPNRRLLNALASMISDRSMGHTKYHEHLQRLAELKEFKHPGIESDLLFEAGYNHVALEPDSLEPYCSRCDHGKVTRRPQRKRTDPQFHMGTILSGERIMQDPKRRDELSKQHHNAICIEMEAAGVTDDTHCLVIRGIADYADSHKYYSWQNYAAATAAAFARELLLNIRSVVVANGDSGPNASPRLAVAIPTPTLDMAEFSSTMNLGKKHYGTAPPDRTIKGLTDAQLCFAHAETMLLESGNDDPSLHLRVNFRLMTVECDLSHDRARSIDERIQHIRRAQEKGSKALTNAFVFRSATRASRMAQVRLEQAFVKGRMAELEEQKEETNGWEIDWAKEEMLRDMDDAMGKLRCLDGEKYERYVRRVGEWKERLRN